MLTRRALLTLPAGLAAAQERSVEDLRLCWCPPGRFRIGSPPSEAGRRADEEQVEVTFARGFWMGKFPQPQDKGIGDDVPLHWVSYLEAEGFCREFTRRASGWRFRIPTEAQWEYACRAGPA